MPSIPADDLPLDYIASDVCVQASREEGLGFSVSRIARLRNTGCRDRRRRPRRNGAGRHQRLDGPAGDAARTCRRDADALDHPDVAQAANAGRGGHGQRAFRQRAGIRSGSRTALKAAAADERPSGADHRPISRLSTTCRKKAGRAWIRWGAAHHPGPRHALGLSSYCRSSIISSASPRRGPFRTRQSAVLRRPAFQSHGPVSRGVSAARFPADTTSITLSITAMRNSSTTSRRRRRS